MVFLDGVRSPTSVLPCHERTWNAGSCCGAATREGVDDVGYINAVVADAIDRFGLDRRRVGTLVMDLHSRCITVFHRRAEWCFHAHCDVGGSCGSRSNY
jgi:hypothetical protein